MSDQSLHQLYDEWPVEQEKRESLAREIFGRYLVVAYDNWLQLAKQMLTEGYQYKSPTDEERRLFDWIDSLSEEDRQAALALVREMLSGVVFSILNHFDGTTAGRFLQGKGSERLRVVVEICPDDTEYASPSDEPLEIIPVNSRQSQEEQHIWLHERWEEWKAKYSQWHEDPKG